MADDTIDLLKNYLLLEPDGAAVLLPGGGDFWSQLMSGDGFRSAELHQFFDLVAFEQALALARRATNGRLASL